jgi:micrococcal nuclease
MLYKYKFKVTSVYDGDSVTGDIDLGFNIIMREQKIRLYGINAPELIGEQRERGLLSRQRLKELVEGKEVILESFKDKAEKYGRWLGILHYYSADGITLINANEQLISEGHAVRYIL